MCETLLSMQKRLKIIAPIIINQNKKAALNSVNYVHGDNVLAVCGNYNYAYLSAMYTPLAIALSKPFKIA